jgi:hypothetical protein
VDDDAGPDAAEALFSGDADAEDVLAAADADAGPRKPGPSGDTS